MRTDSPTARSTEHMHRIGPPTPYTTRLRQVLDPSGRKSLVRHPTGLCIPAQRVLASGRLLTKSSPRRCPYQRTKLSSPLALHGNLTEDVRGGGAMRRLSPGTTF